MTIMGSLINIEEEKEEPPHDGIMISGFVIPHTDPGDTPHVSLKIPVSVRVHELSKTPVLIRTPELLNITKEVSDGIYHE